MKKIGVVFFSLFICAEAWGQSVETVKDTVVEQTADKFKFETNKFFDNWFIGGGAGAQMYFGDHERQMSFGERLAPAFGLYVGKWITPAIGVRVALNGFKMKGVTQNFSRSTGEVYDAAKRLTRQEFNYFNLHGDLMFNLTNMLKGYDENRKFAVSPYAGLGWMHTGDEPAEGEISGNLGVLNSYRVSEGLHITFDLMGTLVDDRFDGELGNRKSDGVLSAAVGLKYTFPKRNWTKSKVTIIRYSDEELNALRTKVNDLANDNEGLRKQLSQAGNKYITDVVVKNRVIAAPVLLTFPINSSVVSDEMRVNIGFLAKIINDGNPEVKYRITGYADQATGSASINERLSKERAKAVKEVLVKEFGLSPERIVTSHAGGIDNMFYDDPRLNRAVITIAD